MHTSQNRITMATTMETLQSSFDLHSNNFQQLRENLPILSPPEINLNYIAYSDIGFCLPDFFHKGCVFPHRHPC